MHLNRQTERSWFWAIGVSLGVAGANLIWLLIDNQPHPMVDEYIVKTIELSRGYRDRAWYETPRHWYWASIGPRPPLFQILASSLVLIFGESVDIILLLNTLALFALGILTYKLARTACSPKYALLATFLVLTFTLTTELSRLVRPHGLSPLFAGTAFLIGFRCLNKPSVGNGWLLMIATGLAFSCHPSNLYILLPMLLTVSLVSFRRALSTTEEFTTLKNSSKAFVAKGLIPAFMLFGLLLATWMFIKWEQYLGLKFVLENYFIPDVEPFKLERDAYLYVNPLNTALLGVAIVAILIADLRSKRLSNSGLLTIWLVGAILIFHTIHKNAYWQNFSGTLPLVSILAAIGLSKINQTVPGWASKALSSAVLLFALQHYLSIGWGIAKIPGLSCGTQNPYCRSDLYNVRSEYPSKGDWKTREIIETVLEQNHCNSERKCLVTLLSHRSQYFSDEFLYQSAVRLFPHKTRFESTDFYPERNITFARMRENWRPSLAGFESDFIIFLTDSSNNSIQKRVEHFPATRFEAFEVDYLLSGKLASFARIGDFKLPNGEVAVIFVAKNKAVNH